MSTIFEFDKFIFTWINTDRSNSVFDLIMPWISHLADASIVWLWIVFIGLIAGWQFAYSTKGKLRNEQRQRPLIIKAVLLFCLYMAIIYGINAGVFKGLKHLFNRPRPFVQQTVVLRISQTISSHLYHDGSFPSGHASNAFMIAALFAERVRRKRMAFYGLASLIALSRIYLGVHYPSDVVIGSCLGLTVTWLMLSFRALRNRITLEHYFLS